MKDKFKIGLVMKSLNTDFFRAMTDGAMSYASEHPELTLVCVGTNTQTEVGRQIDMVRELIAQQVDAIVLVPIDSRELVPPAIEAVRAGIKVVNIDIKLEEQLLKEAGVEIPFLGPDNYTAAYEVAQRLSTKLSAGDHIAVLLGIIGADNARQRANGFMKSFRENKLTVTAFASANWETEQAENIFANMIELHQGLKAVFASNDAMALGALHVMERKNYFLPVVGFDNDVSMKPYLESGKLVATVDIFSPKMAVYGIEYAVKMLRGEASASGEHATPYQLVPQE
jgi:ribose transport system substrate-binding protein